MSTTRKGPIAVLHWTRMRSVAQFIAFMRVFILNLTDHITIFTAPLPAVPAAEGNVDDLEDAETLVKTRVNGAVAARNVQLNVVRNDAKAWLRYVQGVADAAADDDEAIAIIEAAGLGVRKKGIISKPPLRVINTGVEGELKCYAKKPNKINGVKVNGVSYEWQMSTDNGLTWVTFHISLQGHAIINGRTPGERLMFRVRPITKQGEQAWTSAVAIIVM
jgi:hypothetical protein